MRTTLLLFFALLAIAPAVAVAQEAGGYTAGPGLGGDDRGEPDGGTPGHSPEATQDRTFPGTRFWKLDRGHQEFELWWRFRFAHKSAPNTPEYNIVQLEYEYGLTDRIQLDLYENLTDEGGTWTREGTQIEARIAVDPVYGRTPLNPVIYLEWHPLHLGPARAETRLLLGDQVFNDKVMAAVNLFYEQNVTKNAENTFVPNPEAGFTAAASYAVSGQKLRVGGEVKFALEKELFSDDRWEKQLLVGPNISTRIAGTALKLYSTVLFGVTNDARKVDGYLILASEL